MKRRHSSESELFERMDQLERIKKLGSALSKLSKAINWESFRRKL